VLNSPDDVLKIEKNAQMTDLPDTCMFTVYIPCETIHEDDVVVARNLSGADAIKGGARTRRFPGSPHPGEDEYETFRLFRAGDQHAKKWPEDPTPTRYLRCPQR